MLQAFGRGCRQCSPALLLALAVSFPAAAQTAAAQWMLSAGVRHRSLSETADTGQRLLAETGTVAGLRVSAQRGSPDGPALKGEVALAGGGLDYQGQDQSGVALATDSRHNDRELAVYWRPLPAAVWGEAWLGLGWLYARRTIASTAAVGGLTETSTLLMPGIGWSSPALALSTSAAGPKLRLEAQWRASAWHRLKVDYRGTYDSSSLRGGRRIETILRLTVAATGPWQGALEWSRTRQAASHLSSLYLAQALVGTVRQPRMRIDDWSLSVTRRF